MSYHISKTKMKYTSKIQILVLKSMDYSIYGNEFNFHFLWPCFLLGQSCIRRHYYPKYNSLYDAASNLLPEAWVFTFQWHILLLELSEESDFMRMHLNIKMTAGNRFWFWANNIPCVPLTIQLNSWFLTLSQYCKIHQEFNYNCFRHAVLSKKKVLIFLLVRIQIIMFNYVQNYFLHMHPGLRTVQYFWFIGHYK